MADTSFIIHKPKNKSSAKNTTNADMYSDAICPQCGHDHGYKPIGGSAILDMISYLDRDRSEDV